MQKQITEEAIGFLCSGSGQNFFRAILFNSLVPTLVKIQKTDPTFSRGFPAPDPGFVAFLLNAALAIVCLVPWQSEFDKLSKFSKD